MKQRIIAVFILSLFLFLLGCISSNIEPNLIYNNSSNVDSNSTAPIQNSSVTNSIRPNDSGPNNLSNSTNFNASENSSIPNLSTNISTSVDSICPSENCTEMNWRNRSLQLSIPDYRKEIGSDGKLILSSGKLQVILPYDEPSAEEFGRIQLYGLRRAYINTENLLGRPPFDRPDLIIEEFTMNISNAGECCGPESEGFPLYSRVPGQNPRGYTAMINLEPSEFRYLKTANWSRIFNGNHELTHRFIYTLGVSPFINEGLAMYAQDHGDLQPMVCGQGGYNQSGQITPYSYLCFRNVWQFYASGDCFWQRIEEKYGSEMVKKIIARMHNIEERNALRWDIVEETRVARAKSFSGQILIDLNQAFVPELGERFWDDFSDFGFSPTMADGLTFESEMLQPRCG